MAREYAEGPAREIVEQAARELLLAEASDWQFLISTFSAKDYAEIRFKDHIERFEKLSKLAELVHGEGTRPRQIASSSRSAERRTRPSPSSICAIGQR